MFVRPFVFVHVFARPTRPLAPLRLPLHRARPTQSRPPVPSCPTVACSPSARTKTAVTTAHSESDSSTVSQRLFKVSCRPLQGGATVSTQLSKPCGSERPLSYSRRCSPSGLSFSPGASRPSAASCCRKPSMAWSSPSLSGTLGSQLRCCLALVMSGWRRRGSSGE